MGQIHQNGAQKYFDGLKAGSIYVALATNVVATSPLTNQSAMSAVVEPTDATYARKLVAFGTMTYENGKFTIKAPSAQIAYGNWTANATAPITYALLVDSSTKGAGTILGVHQLPSSINPQAGQPVNIDANTIVLTVV